MTTASGTQEPQHCQHPPVRALVGVEVELGAVVHLFAATQAAAIENGGTTPLVVASTGVETLVNPCGA